jgi:hypothetical protein
VRKRSDWFGYLLLVLMMMIGATPAQAADATEAYETQVKAAYLYKFAAYVEWPEGSFARDDSPIVIGVIGADALADELQLLVTGQTLKGRRFHVRRMQRVESPFEVQVLFVGPIERDRMDAALAATRGHPVLTVSDSRVAHARGSMINFVPSGDRLRFQVALRPVTASRLKLSALMLTAAAQVDRGAR